MNSHIIYVSFFKASHSADPPPPLKLGVEILTLWAFKGLSPPAICQDNHFCEFLFLISPAAGFFRIINMHLKKKFACGGHSYLLLYIFIFKIINIHDVYQYICTCIAIYTLFFYKQLHFKQFEPILGKIFNNC